MRRLMESENISSIFCSEGNNVSIFEGATRVWARVPSRDDEFTIQRSGAQIAVHCAMA